MPRATETTTPVLVCVGFCHAVRLLDTCFLTYSSNMSFSAHENGIPAEVCFEMCEKTGCGGKERPRCLGFRAEHFERGRFFCFQPWIRSIDPRKSSGQVSWITGRPSLYHQIRSILP